MLKKDLPLDSIQSIRTALRKRTVSRAVYKNQSQEGARCTKELDAFIGFMTDEECLGFLNSIRKAPFIPGINLMWTEQVIDYLMIDGVACFRHEVSNANASMQADRCIENVSKVLSDEPASYGTKYLKRHVDEENWGLLPKGWCAKYYTPRQVLHIAIHLPYASQVCQYMAEALFIKAADLEDCLSPTAYLPPALTYVPKKVKTKRKNEVILKDFPEGSHIAIDLPEAGKPLAPKVTEIPKVPEVLKVRRNPVVAAQPMFAAEDTQPCFEKKSSKDINDAIMKRYVGFGGKESADELADEFGVKNKNIRERVTRLYKKYPEKRVAVLKKDPSGKKCRRIDTAIKELYRGFGGNLTQLQLAQELKVSLSTIYQHTKKLRAQQLVTAN